MRSWLFAPGDDQKKLAKAYDCGADVVIVDLEDSIAASAKTGARLRWASYSPLTRWMHPGPLLPAHTANRPVS